MSSRREFLRVSLAAGAAAALPVRTPSGQTSTARPGASREGFRFVHLTDIHVEPERAASLGFAKALQAVESLQPKPDFILTGGDLVFDVMEQSHQRSVMLFDLYKTVLADHTSIPVRQTVGNHDVFGWTTKSGVTPQTPGYGKAMVRERLELQRTYYHFDHKGWRFFVLDNIQPGADGHAYAGYLDAPQREWLEAELKQTPAGMPIVTCEHIPFLTVTPFTTDDAVQQGEWRIGGGLVCTDAPDRMALLRRHNVRLCLSGHIHQCDRVEFGGITCICDGAVSGSWWRGPHRGMEEGFGVFDLRPDGTFAYRYHDYGWEARKS